MRYIIPLRGRLIAEIIPENEKILSGGLIIIDRKSISSKAKVLSIGKPTQMKNNKAMKSPASINDIVHFKKYTPMAQSSGTEGYRHGNVTIWWDDIIAVEKKKN